MAEQQVTAPGDGANSSNNNGSTQQQQQPPAVVDMRGLFVDQVEWMCHTILTQPYTIHQANTALSTDFEYLNDVLPSVSPIPHNGSVGIRLRIVAIWYEFLCAVVQLPQLFAVGAKGRSQHTTTGGGTAGGDSDKPLSPLLFENNNNNNNNNDAELPAASSSSSLEAVQDKLMMLHKEFFPTTKFQTQYDTVLNMLRVYETLGELQDALKVNSSDGGDGSGEVSRVLRSCQDEWLTMYDGLHDSIPAKLRSLATMDSTTTTTTTNNTAASGLDLKAIQEKVLEILTDDDDDDDENDDTPSTTLSKTKLYSNLRSLLLNWSTNEISGGLPQLVQIGYRGVVVSSTGGGQSVRSVATVRRQDEISESPSERQKSPSKPPSSSGRRNEARESTMSPRLTSNQNGRRVTSPHSTRKSANSSSSSKKASTATGLEKENDKARSNSTSKSRRRYNAFEGDDDDEDDDFAIQPPKARMSSPLKVPVKLSHSATKTSRRNPTLDRSTNSESNDPESSEDDFEITPRSSKSSSKSKESSSRKNVHTGKKTNIHTSSSSDNDGDDDDDDFKVMPVNSKSNKSSRRSSPNNHNHSRKRKVDTHDDDNNNDDDHDSMMDDSISPSVAAGGGKKRHKWTDDEDEALIDGLREFSKASNKFSLIKSWAGMRLGRRTNVNLKDRYRTLRNKGQLPDDLQQE